MRRTLISALATILLLSPIVKSSGDPAPAPDVWSLIADMRAESHQDALTIKEVYAPYLDTAMFEDVDHIRRALETGELVRIDQPERFNLQLRLTGPSAIGSIDLENQHLYIAARPSTVGMLFDIAKRVQHGPIEVTSLVRTAEYQRSLMRRNGNANTDVPTHAMGYAVDIGLKDMPIERANELRAVLEHMRQAGDIYFIGERNQLTFHIVPVPSRIEHFKRAYETAMLAEAAAGQPNFQPPAADPSAPPPPEPGRFDRIWSWITGLLD